MREKPHHIEVGLWNISIKLSMKNQKNFLRFIKIFYYYFYNSLIYEKDITLKLLLLYLKINKYMILF